MKLTYWYSQCPDDSDVYSVRERTKKAALASIAEKHNPSSWEAPRKVTIEYDNAFELLQLCSEEDHHFWEV